MIQANELRIGNYLYVIGAYPIQVTADHIKSIYEGDKDYKPIPLSPELLLEKCGFEVDNLGYHKKKLEAHGNMIGIWLDDAIWIYNEASTQYNEITLLKPKHLHQLQNLFFALTGKELEVNIQ